MQSSEQKDAFYSYSPALKTQLLLRQSLRSVIAFQFLGLISQARGNLMEKGALSVSVPSQCPQSITHSWVREASSVPWDALSLRVMALEQDRMLPFWTSYHACSFSVPVQIVPSYWWVLNSLIFSRGRIEALQGSAVTFLWKPWEPHWEPVGMEEFKSPQAMSELRTSEHRLSGSVSLWKRL